jgi:NTP pyrophosphatase (non-canonical NTP hydrolase)
MIVNEHAILVHDLFKDPKKILAQLDTGKVDLLHAAFCLSEEVGECQSLIKKHVFNGHGLDREKLKDELGDVLFYFLAILNNQGLIIQDISTANMDKLAKRYPAGYSDAASIKRVDVEQ